MIGRVISHYRILSELGRGGMGVVYAAEDTLLRRQAALKFLPEQYAHEPQWLARFQREARAASALNHPNICTIYEIGEQDGRWFLAMELLQGRTLDRVMTGPIPMPQLVEWSIQICDALEIAHRQGIVHRDLKPSNVFVTERDQTKVLDFGLAKFEDPSPDEPQGSTLLTANLKSPLTSPGQVVGTIAYMSPEQVRGDELDARSDLFSFGTMLYQMATGRMPFEGKTSAMTFDAILNREPVTPTTLNAKTPAALERIIEKALEKSTDLRYQHASDLRADLKRLRRDSSGPMSPRPISDPKVVAVASEPTTMAVQVPSSAPVTAGATLPAAGTSPRKYRPVVWLSAAALCAVLLAFGAYRYLGRTGPVPFQNMHVSRVTASGNSLAAAMSADGKYAVSLHREPDGLTSLWIRHLATNSNTQILAPSDQFLDGVTFGPEDNYVYYRSRPANGLTEDLYRIPVLGGPSVLITRDVDSQPSFSEALQRFCFVRDKPESKGESILSANLDGGDERVIYSGSAVTYDYPAWSPDGSKIALQEGLNSSLFHVAIMDASQGKLEQSLALPERTMEPTGSAWMPDGSGLIVSFRSIATGRGQIGYLSLPGGVFHRITNDLNSYSRVPSLSRDGKTISAVLTSTTTSLDIFPWTFHSTGRLLASTPITSFGDASAFAWMDKDRIVVADHEGMLQSIAVSTGKRTTLFSNEELDFGEMNRCGAQSVVFSGIRRAEAPIGHVSTMDLVGGAPRQLSSGHSDVSPVCTPDGKQVIYFDYDQQNIHTIPVSGGSGRVLVGANLEPDRFVAVTPDGKQIVVRIVSSTKPDQVELAWVSMDSTAIVKRLPTSGLPSELKLNPDGSRVIYSLRGKGSDDLWFLPVSGGAPTRLTEFPLTRGTNQIIESYDFSPDGSQLAMLRLLMSGDLVVFQDQRLAQ